MNKQASFASSAQVQIAFVIAVWVYLYLLHLPNNGLAFSDASRHAGNGLFWMDFLSTLPPNPLEYALSYYARYPVIKPSLYPPLFYWIEAALFKIVGPEPLAAKTLVLLFALATALILLKWIRRWISPEVGWIAALYLLLPGIVLWSHAVMLNIPAIAFLTAALYCANAWMDSNQRSTQRSKYLTIVFSILAALTHYLAGIVIAVLFAWFMLYYITKPRDPDSGGRSQKRFNPVLLVVFLSAITVPCVILVFLWAPEQVTWIVPDLKKLTQLTTWRFYFRHGQELFLIGALILVSFGVIAGLTRNRLRRQTVLLVIWCLTVYVVLSLLKVRDTRYLLFIAPAFVLLIAIGAEILVSRLRGLLPYKSIALRRVVPLSLGVVIFPFFIYQAGKVQVPYVKGVEEVADYLAEVAPNERIFYDDHLIGEFAFHVRAGDPDFQRQVVRGGKLLYAYAIHKNWRLKEYVDSPAAVVERLRFVCGCRWLAIERRSVNSIAAGKHLRDALRGPEFELVRSFPIYQYPATDRMVEAIDVYRLKLEVKAPEFIELPFPILGEDKSYLVKPITR